MNWKAIASAITSTLTILAALPYQLGDLATIVPSEWKPKVVLAGLVSTIILRIWNAATQPPPQEPPKL